MPAAASAAVFTAVRPSPISACATMAITTGLMPCSSAAVSGSPPYCSYAQATPETMQNAGRMNAAPAVTARKPGPGAADVNRELGGVRAGDQVCCAHEIQKLLAAQPAAASHDLHFHERDVGRGSAEADDAQLEEDEAQLTKSGSEGAFFHPCSAQSPRIPLRSPMLPSPVK